MFTSADDTTDRTLMSSSASPERLTTTNIPEIEHLEAVESNKILPPDNDDGKSFK